MAGFRVDAVKHMWPGDLQAIFDSTKDLREDIYGAGERPYFVQEVIDYGENVHMSCIFKLQILNSTVLNNYARIISKPNTTSIA